MITTVIVLSALGLVAALILLAMGVAVVRSAWRDGERP